MAPPRVIGSRKSPAPTSTLPPGRHLFDDVLQGCDSGRYRFARIRAASGRLHALIGVSPEQLRDIERAARAHGVGFVLLGSRVTGPRTRQHALHPALKALPLTAFKRTPSISWPGADDVAIYKDAIKEYGAEDVRTSDLTIFIVDPRRRPPAELESVGRALEDRFRAYGCSFPLKVFTGWEGARWHSEEDFIINGAGRQLRGLLAEGHAFSDAEIAAAVREIYAPVNLPRPAFTRADWANGAFNAGLATATFSLALGFHPVIVPVGFAFGFCGRYLARFKAWIAGAFGEGFASNAAALLFDGSLGVAVMGGLINPLAGYGIALPLILWASALHTLSKGSVRLALDKHFAAQDLRRQSWGVCLSLSLNTVQGLATAYIYAGAPWAAPLQGLIAAVGLFFVFRRPLRRLARGQIAKMRA